MKNFDAIIIGTGQAGKPLAVDLANAGWKVAIIERKHVGGSCINYGCTPTKAMIASAKAAYISQNGSEYGIESGKVRTDFKKIVARRDKIVRDFRKQVEEQLRTNKNIELIKGSAFFSGEKAVTVKLSGVREKKLASKYIFIDTGTTPVIPPIDGINDIDYYTAVSIMGLKELPEHLIILGGGYIGLEFAQMYRRLGSRVTIIEAGEFIPREDEDAAAELRKILENEAIKIYTKTKAEKITADKKKISVTAVKSSETGKTSKVKIEGTHLLIAAGTKPASEDLRLENSNIKADGKGYITVNDRLETNISGIYALGDVKGGPAFTHISYDDYRIVRDNLLRKGSRTVNDRMVPYTVFTDPQLARVGLNEKEAQKNGIKYKIAKLEMTKVARAIETGETQGFIKALIDPDSDQILGCTILAADGGELMSMMQIAMEGKLPYTKLKDEVFAHPLFAEALNNLFGKVE